jgi:hypothetical protein
MEDVGKVNRLVPQGGGGGGGENHDKTAGAYGMLETPHFMICIPHQGEQPYRTPAACTSSGIISGVERVSSFR